MSEITRDLGDRKSSSGTKRYVMLVFMLIPTSVRSPNEFRRLYVCESPVRKRVEEFDGQTQRAEREVGGGGARHTRKIRQTRVNSVKTAAKHACTAVLSPFLVKNFNTILNPLRLRA